MNEGEQGKTPQSGRNLSWISIAGLTYFSVGGGPFGFEESLLSSTPLICLIGLTIMTVFWALPQGLIVSEISTRHQKGYTEWVLAACGPFAACVHSVLRFAFAVLTNAVYATLFFQYLEHALGIDSFLYRTLIILGFEAFVFLINVAGVSAVGKAAAVLIIIVLSPFVIMFILALPHLDLTAFTDTSIPKTMDFPLFISVLLFNLMGWDFAGNVANRAASPRRDVPIGVCCAVVLIYATYALPLLTTISVLGPPQNGYPSDLFAAVGRALWKPLGTIVSVAALCGLASLATAFLATASEALALSTEWSLAPKWTAKRTSRGTPIVAMAALMCPSLPLSICLSYPALVQVQMWVYPLSIVMITAAFAIMRYEDKIQQRVFTSATENSPLLTAPPPFRLPIGYVCSQLLALPPLCLCLFALYESSWQSAAAGAATAAVSLMAAMLWTERGDDKDAREWRARQMALNVENEHEK